MSDFWDNIGGCSFESEASVETRLVMPLLRALGYDETEEISPKHSVIFQEGRLGRKHEADFAVFAERPYSRATSLIVVEAKAPSADLGEAKSQAESYAANLRTPLFVITNGIELEIWQLQLTDESALILRCSVSDLPSQRGEIEAILTKEAVLAHSRGLGRKSFELLARNLGAYERAEFERDGVSHSISRRLKESGPSASFVPSEALLQRFPEGAIIIGDSGFGKTTLISALRRQAVERRWCNDSQHLPIEVFLPDALAFEGKFEDYLHARVEPHCPTVTTGRFRDILRSDGILLLCDAFDRIEPSRRDVVEGWLVNLKRDYPKTQVFITTRPSVLPRRLSLRRIELQELDSLEQQDFVREFMLGSAVSGWPWHDPPSFLRELCRNPLIFDLVLNSYLQQGRLPTEIVPIFDAWLDRIVPNNTPIGRRVELKQILMILANETVQRPLNEDEAVAAVGRSGHSTDLLQDLLDIDALSLRGYTIELRHEILADYLRALHVARLSPQEAIAHLDMLPLRSGNQLPALLMATAPNSDAQRSIWSRIADVGISTAVSSLRYAADMSLPVETADLGEAANLYLADILSGIEVLLNRHFAQLKSRICAELIGNATDHLGIVGSFWRDKNEIVYSFRNIASDDQAVVVSKPDGRRRYGKSLRLMELRLDSGRLVGVDHLRSALLNIVKMRHLDGGIVWAEERATSRLRHLIREYDFPCSIDISLAETRDFLVPYAGRVVMSSTLRAGQNFEIDELIGDLTLLIESGRSHIEKWWDGADNLDLQTLDGRTRLASILNTYYRRVQMAYKEVVSANFPSIADELSYNQMLPLHYEIEMESHSCRGYLSETLNWRWFPVGDFEEAGARVTFPAVPTDVNSEASVEQYCRAIDEALERHGRRLRRPWYAWGLTGIPEFLCNDATFGQIDETGVLRQVSKHIEEDLADVFRELPIRG